MTSLDLTSERPVSPIFDFSEELADLVLDATLDADIPWPTDAEPPYVHSPRASLLATAPVAAAAAPVAAAPSASKPYETSLKVFRRHLKTFKLPDGSARIDAEGVISRACYEDWLATRSRSAGEPEKTFQRILTCCVSGTDGRQPFTADEEAGVLEQIRRKRVWPAFADTAFAIGSKGFRSFGFHEKAKMQLSGELAPTTDSGSLKLVKRVKSQAASPPLADAVVAGSDISVTFETLFSRLANTTEPLRMPDHLNASLSEFEARHASWAALCVDLVNAPASAASLAFFGNLAASGGLMSAVPDGHQLRVLKHIVYCVRVAPGAEVAFATALKGPGGSEVDVHMVAQWASGALLVAAKRA